MLSEIAATHVHNPRNRGELPGATHVGTAGVKGEGPFVRIWLLVQDGRIEHATYDTHGCPASVAAASMAVTLATGRTLGQACQITGEDLLRILGGLPEGKEPFAFLSAEALLNATEDGK